MEENMRPSGSENETAGKTDNTDMTSTADKLAVGAREAGAKAVEVGAKAVEAGAAGAKAAGAKAVEVGAAGVKAAGQLGAGISEAGKNVAGKLGAGVSEAGSFVTGKLGAGKSEDKASGTKAAGTGAAGNRAPGSGDALSNRLSKADRRRRAQRSRRLAMAKFGGAALAAVIALVIVVKLVMVAAGGIGSWVETRKEAAAQAKIEKELAESMEAARLESEAAAAAAETAEGQDVAGVTEEVGNSATGISADGTFTNDGGIHLVMLGDMMTHDNVHNIMKQEDKTYDYSQIFAPIKSRMQDADISIINQETIIGGKAYGVQGYPRFNADFALAGNLVDAGFNVVLQASNHTNDKGVKAIRACLKNWEQYPDTAVLGIHGSEEDAEEIYVYEKDGIRIAILNYTNVMNHALPKSVKSYMVDRLEEEKVRSDIQRAHEIADFVVVCPHWGTEYQNTTDSSQEEWTKIFLEEKVNLVIGTHPHVLQPIEMVTDETTGHEMLVYYSIGNSASWISETGSETQKRVIGGMAMVSIGLVDGVHVGILNYDIEPVICHIANTKDAMGIYALADYTPEMAAEHLNQKYTGDFNFEYIESYCDEVWGELWR